MTVGITSLRVLIWTCAESPSARRQQPASCDNFDLIRQPVISSGQQSFSNRKLALSDIFNQIYPESFSDVKLIRRRYQAIRNFSPSSNIDLTFENEVRGAGERDVLECLFVGFFEADF